jgi:RimJ/RimL family protein N-acetyltransferase
MAVPPADWSNPLDSVLLTGTLVRLEPLSRDHTPGLLNISSNVRIWRYLTTDASSPAKMGAYFDRLLCDYDSGSALPFAIRTLSDGRVIGLTRLKNVSREHRKAIVGSWLEERAWGTGANTEAKLRSSAPSTSAAHLSRQPPTVMARSTSTSKTRTPSL